MRHIHIVTDGSAIGNPGAGGWAAVLTSGKKRWYLSGASQRTTVNEMELTAAIEALKSLEDRAHVTLCSDSEYLIRGMHTLAERWRQQEWLNRNGRPLKDRELWRTLLSLRDHHTISWRWVRGHSGHKTQMEADARAYTEARRMWDTSRRVAA